MDRRVLVGSRLTVGVRNHSPSTNCLSSDTTDLHLETDHRSSDVVVQLPVF